MPTSERNDASIPPEEPDSTYTLVRYASIGDRPASGGRLEWIVVTHWDFDGGHKEWYTEYWAKSRNEEAPEELHASCDDAVAHAERRFGALSWTPGGPPLSTIDDETLRATLLDDVALRPVSSWVQGQSGKTVDADQLLEAVKRRTGDMSLTLDDLDQAMRRLHGHRAGHPLPRFARALLGRVLGSPRPEGRGSAYFIDAWSWQREIRRRPRRSRRQR